MSAKPPAASARLRLCELSDFERRSQLDPDPRECRGRNRPGARTGFAREVRLGCEVSGRHAAPVRPPVPARNDGNELVAVHGDRVQPLEEIDAFDKADFGRVVSDRAQHAPES